MSHNSTTPFLSNFLFFGHFLPFLEGFLASFVRDPGPGTRGSEAEGVRSGVVETPGLRPGSCVGGVFAVRRASAVGPGRPMLGSVLFIGRSGDRTGEAAQGCDLVMCACLSPDRGDVRGEVWGGLPLKGYVWYPRVLPADVDV